MAKQPDPATETNLLTYLLTYLFTYLVTRSLTNSMVQNIILKADCHSAFQKKYRAFFMELDGSLPCSQKPTTGPYPGPAESSSHHGS